MHLLSVLPLALTASAFLVPTNVSPVLHVTKVPATSKYDKIALECNGCPILLENNGWALSAGHKVDSTLHAKAVVIGHTVLLNGQQVYPPTKGIPMSFGQTVDKEDIKAFKGLIPASTSIEYKQVEVEQYSDSDTPIFIQPISIEILALRDQVVHAETVELRVADINGKISLFPSRIRAYEASPYTDSCSTVWCRVKGTIAEKYNKWRAAASRKISGLKGGCSQSKVPVAGRLPIKGGPNKYGGSLRPGRPQVTRPHGHHGHHGHMHRSGSYIDFVFRTMFMLLFGLGSGIMVGVVAFIAVTVVRRMRAIRRGDYIVVEQVEVEEGRASMEGPPKYEDVYRAPQEDTEDEKKELLQ